MTPTRRNRIALSLALIAYICVGLHFGLALHSAMPALNWRGVAYITATWPLQLKVSPIRMPIPSWVFSFKD